MPLKGDSVTTKFKNYSSELVSDKNFSSNDVVLLLLKALKSADDQLCANIENDLVSMGRKAVDQLIDTLNSPDRKLRKYAAMALIRIGQSSVDPILSKYRNNTEDTWVAEFIISEIQGSRISISGDDSFDTLINDSYCKSMAS